MNSYGTGQVTTVKATWVSRVTSRPTHDAWVCSKYVPHLLWCLFTETTNISLQIKTYWCKANTLQISNCIESTIIIPWILSDIHHSKFPIKFYILRYVLCLVPVFVWWAIFKNIYKFDVSFM
jgi:hypothetical protein